MKIQEFQSSLENDVERFFTYYKGMNVKFPKEWPLTMKEGDWYEQFLMWQQQQND